MGTIAQRLRRAARQIRVDGTPLSERSDNDLIDAVIRHTVGPVSACIDVGAHAGRFTRSFVHHAPQGRHLAVEPLPWAAAQLRERYRGVDVREVALSDSHGTAQFHFLPDHPGRSSLRRRRGWETYQVQTFDVTVTTLDALAAGRDYALIKIDVEGAQYQVLRGALATLRRCRPIVVFEHGRPAEIDFGTTSGMIHDLFASCTMGLQDLEGFLVKPVPLDRDAFANAVVSSPRHNFVAFPA
jgi:FkbM family methyltransferase